MLFAVIVELTDTDFWDIVFSCICPNPFLRYFVLFGNLLGSVVLSYIKVIFNSSSFIGRVLSISSMSALRIIDILALILDALSLSSLTSL